MGMSGDFEAAIEMGSTNVRVGSTIFGARPSALTALRCADACMLRRGPRLRTKVNTAILCFLFCAPSVQDSFFERGPP